MPHRRSYLERLTSTQTAPDRQLATGWQGLRGVTGGVRDRGGEVGIGGRGDKKQRCEGKQLEERDRSGNEWRKQKMDIKCKLFRTS